jgi:hypothetical protein
LPVFGNNIGSGNFIVNCLALTIPGGPEKTKTADKPANPVTDAVTQNQPEQIGNIAVFIDYPNTYRCRGMKLEKLTI